MSQALKQIREGLLTENNLNSDSKFVAVQLQNQLHNELFCTPKPLGIFWSTLYLHWENADFPLHAIPALITSSNTSTTSSDAPATWTSSPTSPQPKYGKLQNTWTLSCTSKCNEHSRSLSTAWHLVQSTVTVQVDYKAESFLPSWSVQPKCTRIRHSCFCFTLRYPIRIKLNPTPATFRYFEQYI